MSHFSKPPFSLVQLSTVIVDDWHGRSVFHPMLQMGIHRTGMNENILDFIKTLMNPTLARLGTLVLFIRGETTMFIQVSCELYSPPITVAHFTMLQPTYGHRVLSVMGVASSQMSVPVVNHRVTNAPSAIHDDHRKPYMPTEVGALSPPPFPLS